MKLFLDACIIIYWLELKEPYYASFLDALQKIDRQYPQASLIVSRLSLLECLVKPLREKNNKLLTLYQEFFSNPELEIVEINAEVIDIAAHLRATLNLKTPDALHAACALILQDEVKFITNDKTLESVPNLTVICI